ncbi:hypothetical protein ACH4E8_14150 [Streptomyces sp. NPDC017979]|uniref:hypothetical protein n=1 Tax=Streptomyces sp. NPDC017979 TaxID=3365024 RepID=UPI0037B6CBE0
MTAVQLDAVTLQIPLSAILLLPLATGPITTELTRGTARTTWLTLADRPTAFCGKLLISAALGGAGALVGAALTALAMTTTLALTGRPHPVWGQTLPSLLGYTLFMICWPVIATSVAALVRNRAATAMLLVLWPLLGERITALLLRVARLDVLAGWLPFGAGRAAMAEGADTLPQTDRPLVDTLVGSDLSAGPGAALFLAFTVVAAVVGARSYRAENAS